MRRKDKTPPARQPHPDPAIELKLQRIIGCQRTIARYEQLIADYRDQMEAVNTEQDNASYSARTSRSGRDAYDAISAVQEKRMTAAQAGIAEAEKAITAQHEAIAKLASEMEAVDLAYL